MNSEQHYYSLNNYLKDRFGEKIYKISIDAGMTCPNRDGTKGIGGCSFCAGGSGMFAVHNLVPSHIDELIEKGKQQTANKAHCKKFIAYFQSYTNTYAPASYLKQLFERVIVRKDIAVLSIATRPDCLPNEVISLLSDLNKIKPVWVELGLQTSNENTARNMNRCFENSDYINAVKMLKAAGIVVITHIIIGLPGEMYEDYIRTVEFTVKNKSDGIKLQLLHVLKGTKLAEMYTRGEFKCLEKDEYINILMTLLPKIPKETVIHRLTGDGDRNLLIAPLWSLNKKDVLNSINKAFNEHNIYQGVHTESYVP